MTQREERSLSRILEQIVLESKASAARDMRVPHMPDLSSLEKELIPDRILRDPGVGSSIDQWTNYVGTGNAITVFMIGGGMHRSVIDDMQEEINELKERVAALKAEVEALKSSEEEVIVLRTVTKEQAKREALALFEAGKPLLYSDVARLLRIDLETAVKICEELIAEGKVAERGTDSK